MTALRRTRGHSFDTRSERSSGPAMSGPGRLARRTGTASNGPPHPQLAKEPPMRTRHLLTAGVVAGPLFVTVVALQLATRDGFDLTHHPISLLSLGDAGWVQVANFVVAGVLSGAFAVGLSRVLVSGPGHRWAPRLLGVYGVGLVIGGLFVPDPALGYPVGTPDEVPDSIAWHDRFLGRRGWARYSAATAAAALLVTAWPHPDSISWRLAIGVVIGFAWLTALAVRERAALVSWEAEQEAVAA